MSLICPQCSQVNQDQTGFCRACGYRFQGNEMPVDEGATIRPASLAAVPSDADPSETLKPSQPAVAQPTPVMVTPQPQTPPSSSLSPSSSSPVYEQPPVAAPAPAPAPSPAPVQSPFFPQQVPYAQGGYPPQQAQPVYGQYPPQGGYGVPVPAPAPVHASPSLLSTLQRGFAGKGTPVHHRSWLIENKQVAPQTLTSAFIANFQKQNVMGVQIEPERLREYGAVLEERDYVKVRYGASSVFVYLAPMGQNLYVSRTSTIRQPYSRVRMVMAATLFVIMVIALILSLVINPSTLDDVGAFYSVLSTKGFFVYIFDGLLIFFLAALLRSVVFWLTDKDFLAILRPNRLSDFSLDALSSIEETTDKALRVTLQDAGLDAQAIQLSQSLAPQQPLHRI